MEGLILLFGEFIGIGIVAALGFIGNLLALTLGLLASLAEAIFSAFALLLRRLTGSSPPQSPDRLQTDPADEKPAASDSSPPPLIAFLRQPHVHRWCRRIATVTGASLALVLLTAIVIHTFFFDSALRMVFRHVERNTGIHVSFEAATGSFWHGQLKLSNAEIRRQDHPQTNFDFEIDELNLDVSVGKLLRGTAHFEKLQIAGMRGRHERLQIVEEMKARRHFVIENFQMRDVELEVVDHTRGEKPVVAEVTFESFETERFRSSLAVFDVLFRSNATGSLDQQPFLISSREIPDGRETRWKFEQIPIGLVHPYLGQPLTWITEGTVDIDVFDRWSLGETAEIDMDWSLVFHDIRAEVPGNLPRSVKAMAVPTVAFLNLHDDELPLSFSVKMDQEKFTGKASLEAVGLFEAAQKPLVAEIARQAKLDESVIEEAGGKMIDSFKNFLDRRRKP